jgi:hypothetical protein
VGGSSTSVTSDSDEPDEQIGKTKEDEAAIRQTKKRPAGIMGYFSVSPKKVTVYFKSSVLYFFTSNRTMLLKRSEPMPHQPFSCHPAAASATVALKGRMMYRAIQTRQSNFNRCISPPVSQRRMQA